MSPSPEWEAANAAIEVAQAADRLFMAGVEVRLARMKQAAELERQGRMEEAAVIIRDLRAEQEAICASTSEPGTAGSSTASPRTS